MEAPKFKGNVRWFINKVSRFLPSCLQSSDAASTYLKKSDATIIIKYSADGGTTILDADAVGVTHIGIAKKAGLTTAEQAVATNYTWIAKNVIES